MGETATLILAGVGVWFAMEGLLAAFVPEAYRRMLLLLTDMPRNELVFSGLFAAAIGLGVIALAAWLG